MPLDLLLTGTAAGPQPGQLPADLGSLHDLHQPGTQASLMHGQAAFEVDGAVVDLPRVPASTDNGG